MSSAMLEGKQIGCYRKQWLPCGITKGQLCLFCTNSFFVSEEKKDICPLRTLNKSNTVNILYFKTLCINKDYPFAVEN